MATASPDVDLGPARDILQAFEQGKDNTRVQSDYLIPLLQRIQKTYGYLPRSVLDWVSQRTGIPSAHIYGVVTFYAQFYTEPQGRLKINCCRGTACHVRGGAKVIGSVMEVLGIEEGETTPDLMFSFETVACLGTCAIAPVMVVDQTYHGRMTATGAEKLLRRLMREESQ
jgi:NADH-quinone oxidoreductase subunit E